MSLKTLMLFHEMKKHGLDGRLKVYPTQEVLDDKGNPHRTIEFKGKNIGYNSTLMDYVIIEDGISKKTIPEILVEIEKI